MIGYSFSDEKNRWLKENRNICFEEILFFLENGLITDIIDNPNQTKYKKEFAYVVEVNNYFYAVPFIEKDDEIHLKIIMQNRDINKKYQELKYGKKEKK